MGDVLPPFMGGDVVGAFHPRSPYISSMAGLVRRFAISQERIDILRGLKRLRDALRGVGFKEGFQWIDGSFVEACETVKGRPPGDIDVVTVVHRPEAHHEQAAWIDFVAQHGATLLDSEHCKATYSCDAYYIDLDIFPRDISEQSAYWFGLFSHQRETFRWKGLVQVDLQSDDEAAMQILDEIEAVGW